MKTPGRTDDVNLPDAARALGRTRIEIVPRDASSVFVYWEVANLADDAAETPQATFDIDIRRESDDESGASFETQSRLDGQIVEVPAGERYYATLALRTGEGRRQLTRSSTLAGTMASVDEGQFVTVTAGDDGLETSDPQQPAGTSVRWDWKGTDSSNR